MKKKVGYLGVINYLWPNSKLAEDTLVGPISQKFPTFKQHHSRDQTSHLGIGRAFKVETEADIF